MEISNKTLTWLVVLTIAVSVLGTGFSLNKLNKGMTGLAIGDNSTATGQANVTISTQTVLRYAIAVLDFGSGSVNVTTQQCNLTLNGTGNVSINKSGCDGLFNDNAYALTLENAGSTPMNVSLNFSKNASILIGGGNPYPEPIFEYAVSNNESNSCGNGLSPTGWTNVTVNNVSVVCSNLSYIDGADSLIIGIKLGIPINAPSGVKTVNILAQGTSLT